MHTRASDGLMTAAELVDYAEQATRLDVIAVTDHDETAAGLEAREYALRMGYRVQVISGVEVSTRDGHLLALFIEQRPPALRPLRETAEWYRSHNRLATEHSLLDDNGDGLGTAPDAFRGLHAIEKPQSPSAALDGSLARRFCLVQHGAHVLGVVGLAHTRFHGHTPDDLRRGLERGTTFAEGRFASPREVAAEAVPQLARSMVHLPLRRLARFARGQ